MFAIAKKRRSDESQFVIMALIPCQELKKAKKISKTEKRKKRKPSFAILISLVLTRERLKLIYELTIIN